MNMFVFKKDFRSKNVRRFTGSFRASGCVKKLFLAFALAVVTTGCGASKPKPQATEQAPTTDWRKIKLKSNDSRFVIVKDSFRDIDVRWIGEMDDDAMERSAADIYEQMRVRMNGLLKENQTDNKIFVSVVMCRRPIEKKGPGEYYFTANSGKVDFQIPAWSEAVTNYPFGKRDKATRPSVEDEETFLEFKDRYYELGAPSERDDAGKRLRADFCSSHNITQQQLSKIEDRYYAWSMPKYFPKAD